MSETAGDETTSGPSFPRLAESMGDRWLLNHSPATTPLESFYLPLLSSAVSYDRAVGYWTANEIRLSAQGMAEFLSHGGKMRLIVGAQLQESDIAAITEGTPIDEVLATRMLADPAWAADELLANDHLGVLAWMLANDRLEIRVGVPIDEQGRYLTYEQSGNYFHSKFGIFTDPNGNQIAFMGSNNATAAGWLSNYETFDAYPSWIDLFWQHYGRQHAAHFERLWNDDPDPGWAILPLPEAVSHHLVNVAPDQPPLQGWKPPQPTIDWNAARAELDRLRDAPLARDYTAAGTAPVTPLPHQAALIDRSARSYPRGYLFADEVGLGKTVEIGLSLRELLLSGAAETALLLVPAAVLKQWQEELRDKIGLYVARYDGGQFIDHNNIPIESSNGHPPWSAFPIVLASSHLARRRERRKELLNAGPWDIVVVDEAHHARRSGSKPTDTPNALLRLLQDMHQAKKWRALYLATATPMQMNPHEAWDLIQLLDLPGSWGRSADDFIAYYQQLREEDLQLRSWQRLARMLNDYVADPEADKDAMLQRQMKAELGAATTRQITNQHKHPLTPETATALPLAAQRYNDKWLRRHTPMRDRVYRNTRKTLRAYADAGILTATIPERDVEDVFIDLDPTWEKPLYDRIEQYIKRHYGAYKTGATNKALGFIMTIYRRRLTSSFEAIRSSLRRRLDVLEQGKALGELLTADDAADLDHTLFDLDVFDDNASDLLVDEITELKHFLADLDKITGEDTKASQLTRDLSEWLSGEGPASGSLVVFTQYTDTLDYVRDKVIAADFTHNVACFSGRGGEIYNPTTDQWDKITKPELKRRFRDGEITILLGTDAMSEGLNLQSSGRLINYDMPWNLMRVEQRIGRVDRIGGKPNVYVTNYFYSDTVEQRVYDGIKADYDDFTDIVGNAQPVLAKVEDAIEEIALVGDRSVEEAIGDIQNDIDAVNNQAVKNEDLGDPAPDQLGEPPVLIGHVTLADLQEILTKNPITGPHLRKDDGHVGEYELNLGGADRWITFNRSVNEDNPEAELITYGHPLLNSLLELKPGNDEE